MLAKNDYRVEKKLKKERKEKKRKGKAWIESHK